MRVETNTFEASHGQRPRGFGLWMFQLLDGTRRSMDEPFSFSGTYTNAKAAAKTRAREVGATTVQVLP